MLLALTNFWRRRVDGFEVLGEDQRRRLRATGIAGGAHRARARWLACGLRGGPDGRSRCQLISPAPACCSIQATTVSPTRSRRSSRAIGGTTARAPGESGCGSVPQDLGRTEVAERLRKQGLPFHKSDPVPLERLAALAQHPSRAPDCPEGQLRRLCHAFEGLRMPRVQKSHLFSLEVQNSDVELLARGDPAGYWRISCGDPAGFAAALEELADQVCRSQPAATV